MKILCPHCCQPLPGYEQPEETPMIPTNPSIDDKGRFKSSKHPMLPIDRVRLNIQRRENWPGLLLIADAYQEIDPEFAAALRYRIGVLSGEPVDLTGPRGQEVLDGLTQQATDIRSRLADAKLASAQGVWEAMTTDDHLGDAARRLGIESRTLKGDAFEHSFEWARQQQKDEESDADEILAATCDELRDYVESGDVCEDGIAKRYGAIGDLAVTAILGPELVGKINELLDEL